MRAPSMTMVPFRIDGLPVPLMIVAPSMAMTPPGRCCAPDTEATNTQTRAMRTALIFHVFMFAFLEQNLNPLLRHKRKHDERAKGISPPKVHPVAHQQSDQENHRKIRIAESEYRSRF